MRRVGVLMAAVFLASLVQTTAAQGPECRVASFDLAVTLPGGPEKIYDAITGDISGWWDHSFSQKPLRFYIEPKPGGGFYEIFNQQEDGVLHARVIYAERGKLLRFDGPLGLSGRAVKMVTTYQFAPVGPDSTRLTVSVHMSGEMDEKTPHIVKQVWHHFIIERFKPFIEAGGRTVRENPRKD